MPFYTYKCKQCDHVFEAYQRMTDNPLTECPVCEGGVRRIIDSVGVIFKGPGFYVTDSRNGKSEARKPEKEKAKSSSETSQDKAD